MRAQPTPATPTSRPSANDAEVAAAIASYVPTCLPGHRWARCADAVRAAVTATNPPTAKVARLLLAHLCQFLSTPCGWAGDGPPDLATLLTESTIATYTYTAGSPANRASGVSRRSSLRSIARAAGSVVPAPLPFAKTTTTALRPELLAAARLPIPVAGIAQAWELAHGRALPQDAFRPVVSALQSGRENTDAGPGTGTFALPGSAWVLAEATDQPLKEVTASMNKPSSAGAPSAAKKLSRRAVLRYAKANLAAGQAHRAGPTLADAPEPATVSGEVAAAIAAYQPEKKHRGSWAELAELTRRLTLGYGPPSAGNAGSTATHVAAFLRWFRTWPGRADVNAPLDPRELLVAGVVEAYLPFAPGSPGSRSTQRAVLRRALRSLNASAPAPKLAYQPVSAPYTPAQCARFVALARHQPSLGRKRNMAFLVGLGLGAGLDGHDLKTVTRADLVDVRLDASTTVMMVTVSGATRPRTVPVRARYEALVREGLELHDRCGRGPDAVLLGLDTTRDHVTSPVTERAVTADTAASVEIEASRLRNTWLVAAMCAPVPLADLLRAAGLRGARTIGDLLAYCPEADPDARWGYRTQTFDNKTKMCFGYQLIAFTRVGAVGQEDREPLLTDRIVVVAANASMSEPSISALDRFAAGGRPVTEVIVDRGFSNYTPDNWAYGLRDRGIEQVLDLCEHDYGATDFNGVPMIAGWPHCPAMPAELEEIRHPVSLTAGTLKKSATALQRMKHTRALKEIADFHEKIAAREMYAFVRTSLGQDRSKTGKAKGSEQYMCPAQAGKAICERCPLSKYAPSDLPRVPNPPAEPDVPAACRQRTISVPMTVSPKLRQRTRWGTPAWIASYNRRSRVEASFGLLKNEATGNVKRGWTRQVGIIKTTLLLAVAVTASNLRQLLTWSRDTGDVTDPLTLMEVGPTAFEEIDPDAGGVGNTGPPTAA